MENETEEVRELIIEELMDFSYIGQTKKKDGEKFTLEYSTRKDIEDPLGVLESYEKQTDYRKWSLKNTK